MTDESRTEIDRTATGGRPPVDLQGLRALIAERHSKLPKRLKQAGKFALEHPQEVALGTAAEIAEKADVQPSTLVRFAQSLGYNGFSELQAVFRSHARERWPEYGERLEALRNAPSDVGPGALLSGFVEASRISIDRLESTVSPDALERAVSVLATARTIHLIGARRAYPVVTYLSYALAKLGVVARLIDQAEGIATEQVDLIQDGDAALSVSFTPYTPTTLELTARAVARGIPVVAITDTPFSPLVRGAQVWLEVADADHASFRSLAGTLVLAMTLAVAVAERRRETDRVIP